METRTSNPPAAVSADPGNSDGRVIGAGGRRPGFVWCCRVYFDELDPMGMLHNARYALLLERTSSAFFEANGWQWERDPARNPDGHHVVREQNIRYLAPIRGTTDVIVEMWVARLGTTSATYAFEIRSADCATVHAQAQRVTIKLDPVTYQPVAWTPALRDCLNGLLRTIDQS
jgi:acyl-CoA thioester hydrolase